MVIYDRYDIVFQEIPNEVSLAFTLKGCPNNCVGCHSIHLRENFGEELTKEKFIQILTKYQKQITCVLFLGDGYSEEIKEFLKITRLMNLKTALYSGLDQINSEFVSLLDFYKIGSYQQLLGGLNSTGTNQKLYQISQLQLTDITSLFWREHGE